MVLKSREAMALSLMKCMNAQAGKSKLKVMESQKKEGNRKVLKDA